MSNKRKLRDPSLLQSSIVLWRQIKTMFLGCKSGGPPSAEIKVAEPTGMLTSLCLNQSPGRIEKKNRIAVHLNRGRCRENEFAVHLCLKSLWDNFTICSRTSLQHTWSAGECFFCSVCVTSFWIRSSAVESVCKCYMSRLAGPKLPAWTLPATETTSPEITPSPWDLSITCSGAAS